MRASWPHRGRRWFFGDQKIRTILKCEAFQKGAQGGECSQLSNLKFSPLIVNMFNNVFGFKQIMLTATK